DIVEMQADALKEGQRVLLLDDLLATGGTLRAALQLVDKVGARVVEAFVLIELAPLRGRAVLPPDCTVEALIKYDD
ncbi:Protein T19B4.3, partial [Aphelenchoides avenae]